MTGTFTDADWAKRAHLTFVVGITVVAALLIGGGDAQANRGAKYDFRVFPRVGTPTTTFRVTFNAPFAADGVDTDYTLEAVGPRRCASVFEFTIRPTRRDDRVVLTLTASDDLFFGNRRRWCRGSYVGYVYYTTPGSLPNKLIGYLSFGVGRFPVSLAG
ncbi:MAG: hypothetical protein ABW135_16990 [Thermoleophilaceae bacterium]